MTEGLSDAFRRRIRYLRLSVTDQCDLRCRYCLPKGFKGFEEPAHWLNFDEIRRLAGLFAGEGVSHIRLTGGEPLLRRNLPDLVAALAGLDGVERISLSTNAVRLAGMARALDQAGVNRVNISLDSLRPERFRELTGGRLYKVLDGIEAAREAGIEAIRINMVVMKGVNDDEVEALLEFCLERGLTLRYIETMPMGETGRRASEQYLNLQAVKQRLSSRYELIPILPRGEALTAGPARYMRIAGTKAKVGFITPISENFCATCNRVRMGVDGTLYLCLGQNASVPLGRHLREGAGDGELIDILRRAMQYKPERHEFNEKPGQIVRFMSVTGG